MFAIIPFFLLTAAAAYYLIKRDRGSKEPISMLWAAFGFGGLAVVITLLYSAVLVPDAINPEALEAGMLPSIGMLFFGSMMIGIVEETAKSLPLALFLKNKHYFNEYTDGVIYFALSGLAFALIENILYALQFGSGVGLIRILVAPFLHAAASGIVGYYLVQSKIRHQSLAKPALALAAAAGLHGLYDFGLFSGQTLLIYLSLLTTALLNVALFVYYWYATKQDQLLGKSAVGINKYCRSCGQPNTQNSLFCIYCGKKT